MGGFIKLIVIGILGYFVVTQGLPMIKEKFGDRPRGAMTESASEAGLSACIGAAEQANSTLSGQIRQFSRPPIDSQAWGFAFTEISRDIGAAEIQCGSCFSESCAAAGSAVAEMRAMALQFDGMASGNSRGFSNPASRQERIDGLLQQARSLSGGS